MTPLAKERVLVVMLSVTLASCHKTTATAASSSIRLRQLRLR